MFHPYGFTQTSSLKHGTRISNVEAENYSGIRSGVQW